MREHSRENLIRDILKEAAGEPESQPVACSGTVTSFNRRLPAHQSRKGREGLLQQPAVSCEESLWEDCLSSMRLRSPWWAGLLALVIAVREQHQKLKSRDGVIQTKQAEDDHKPFLLRSFGREHQVSLWDCYWKPVLCWLHSAAKERVVLKPITFANRKDGWEKLLEHLDQ